MRNGKIVFNEERVYPAGQHVKEKIIVSLYYKTKYNPKWDKVESVVIDKDGFYFLQWTRSQL